MFCIFILVLFIFQFIIFRVNGKLTQSYDHETSEHKLLGKTIGQAFTESAQKFPDNEAAVFHRDNKRISYDELNQKVLNLQDDKIISCNVASFLYTLTMHANFILTHKNFILTHENFNLTYANFFWVHITHAHANHISM